MGMRRLIGSVAIVAVASGCVTIDRVDTSVVGGQADAAAAAAVVSGNGRFVAFVSTATNLVPGVADGKQHAYRKDRSTGAIVVVDRDSQGAPSSGNAGDPVISDDGTKVAFGTDAPLTSADRNTVSDVYVRDLVAGTTTLASLMPNGSQIPTTYPSGAWPQAFDATGNKLLFLVFMGSLPPRNRVEQRDLAAGTTTELTGDRQITEVHASRDGKHLMMNIGCFQIGGCFPQPSVVDLANPYAYTPTDWCGGAAGVAISDDGRYLVYLGGDGSGRCTQVPVVYDRTDGSRQLLSSWAPAPDHMWAVDASGDVRFVLFRGDDTALPGGTPGRSGFFALDRSTGHVERISANAANVDADADLGYQDFAHLSRDGRTAVFTHGATNLVSGDTNGFADAFARIVGVPEIAAVVPASLPRGASNRTVVVSGKEFLPGVFAVAGDGVTVHAATPNAAGTQLTLDVSIAANAPTGTRLLTVANPATVGFAGAPCVCFGVT